MILEFGDMWSILDQTDLFCITANSTIRSDGKLVMGRGLALEAAQRFPELPEIAGRAVKSAGVAYGVIILYPRKTQMVPLPIPFGKLALFQVKYHWSQPARLDLIERAVTMLIPHTETLARVDLNFPGIGNGRLEYNVVLPLVSVLPDSVHLWQRNRVG